ncbi:hypothetical protein RA8CHR_05388 [Variovorax sp. RA8]|nr:hypothetical protein RA8CHR_05388 [Variovorax sp. RA8]
MGPEGSCDPPSPQPMRVPQRLFVPSTLPVKDYAESIMRLR